MYLNPTSTRPSELQLDPLAQSVLRTLLYFDVFCFPLTTAEISRFMDVKGWPVPALEELKEKNLIQAHKGYWGFGSLVENIRKREEGAKEAARLMPRALHISKSLSHIPFIQSVCLSGSISKGYMDEDSDIDFFLVVQPGRLWIVRFIFSMVILGFGWLKVKKYFCPNYIMTSDQLQVGDRNRFTATEIHSLIPTYNGDVFQQFLRENQWSFSWFPQAEIPLVEALPPKRHRLRWLWDSPIFSALDVVFFRMYHWHYSRKFGNLKALKLSPEDIRFRRNTYKMHNTGHRSRILETYHQKLKSFEDFYFTRIQP